MARRTTTQDTGIISTGGGSRSGWGKLTATGLFLLGLWATGTPIELVIVIGGILALAWPYLARNHDAIGPVIAAIVVTVLIIGTNAVIGGGLRDAGEVVDRTANGTGSAILGKVTERSGWLTTPTTTVPPPPPADADPVTVAATP